MALTLRKGLCETITPFVQFKRFRGKINIQHPKPPHFEKAKYLALTKPWYISPNKYKKPQELCKNLTPSKKEDEEVNHFQEIIAQELRRWFSTSKLIGFCHANPITADQRYKAHVAFYNEKMHFKQYGKKTLEMAIKGTPYETVLDFYVSHNMIIFSPEPDVRKMLKIMKKFPQLILLAGIYENHFLSRDDLTSLSLIPNLQAAQSHLVQTLEAAGAQLVTHLNSHQTTLVSNLEERIKQLDGCKGE